VGIGLYLARSIMQQQDGYIRLSSTPGEGSTFGLYFPTAIVSKL
jgi:two-component system sensor histidine kinase SenX3